MKAKKISLKIILLLLFISLFGGIIGGVITFYFINYQDWNKENSEIIIEKQVYIESSQIIDVIKKISPSIVSIVIKKDLPKYKEHILKSNDPFYEGSMLRSPFSLSGIDQDRSKDTRYESKKVGGGTGFIVTADGIIVTNEHVVTDKSANYIVILNNGVEYNANIIKTDKDSDIAMLQLESDKTIDGLPVVKFGDSNKIQIGQQVIAIGNAVSEYANTVSTGVVSAKGRSITAGSIIISKNLNNLIQTDASINSGNSGGPLINLDGQVIGINTAFLASDNGISFAIPINEVKTILKK